METPNVEYVEINSSIDSKGTYCLNESNSHKCENIFKNDPNLYLESDTDEQLLISLTFKTPTKLKHIRIKTTKDDRAPKTLKFYVNRPTMDFSDTESFPPTQVITLSPNSYAPEESSSLQSALIDLSFVKFQNVSKLAIFVESNQGNAPTTVINYLSILGDLGEKKHEDSIEYIKTDAEFDEMLKNAGEKPVIVDFTATWCGPCSMIAPVFLQYSKEYPELIFLKVDVDVNKVTSARYKITSLPTFFIFKNRQKIDQMNGAVPDKLRAFIEKHKNS